MRGTRLIIVIAAVLIFVTPFVSAADTENKNWMIFEQGNAAFASREFGHALQLYKDAIAGAGVFPEAEMAIGDIYLEEGEPDLAIKQYNNAYNMRKSFYIPDFQYQVLYKLARLYLARQMYGQMEQALLSIQSDDKHFAETQTFQLRTQIKKNFLEKGLDRVLMLYVFDDQFAAQAHSMLGWYYYRSGRQTQAIEELLFSLISRTTEIVVFLHERDAEYGFSSLADMLGLAMKDKNAVAFLKEIDFFKDVYYLACVTNTSGYPQTAATLWKLVSTYSIAGTYQDLAKRQLKSPWTDPILIAPVAQ
jgi:tetratricopeptide (TPR) repeat protein